MTGAGDSASVLRLGTRRSALAVTQSTWVADQLRAAGHAVELVEIVTEGDVNRAPLAQIGGTGVFASAIREALLDGRVDFAVHSLKDLPVVQPDGLVIAAIPPREDARDALITRDGTTLAELPAGATIGTGSPRRAAQLVAARPDIVPVEVRGNVGTRLNRASVAGDLDAVVLACAGLRRLGLADRITEPLDFSVMLPAAGQGALAIECRADREDVRVLLASVLEDADTRAAVDAERAVLATLEAGCSAPVAALARIVRDVPSGDATAGATVPSDPTRSPEPELVITALLADPDVRRAERRGPVHDAVALGMSAAGELLHR